MTSRRQSVAGPQASDRRAFLRRTGALGVASLAGLVLAGCRLLAARDDSRHTVTISQRRRFEPAALTIPLGATVVWENMSTIRHAVTTDASRLDDAEAVIRPSGVGAFDSGDLFPGETWALTFTLAGSYVYVCPYHYDVGMVGSIIVEE